MLKKHLFPMTSFIYCYVLWAGISGIAIGTEKSFLGVEDLLELYESTQSAIGNNMHVSYSLIIIEESQTRPNYPQYDNLVNYHYVDRYEDGDRFYVRYSKEKEGFDDLDKVSEYAFNGKHMTVYYPMSRSGEVRAGKTGRSIEKENELRRFMMIQKLQHKGKDGTTVESPFFRSLAHPKVSTVRETLESVSGELCHVIDTKNGGRIMWTIWLAVEKGGLPMKYERYNNRGKCDHRQVVTKLGSTLVSGNLVYYPTEGFRVFDDKAVYAKQRFECNTFEPNIEMDSDLFTVKFPGGTRVLDVVLGAQYFTGGTRIDGEEGNSFVIIDGLKNSDNSTTLLKMKDPVDGSNLKSAIKNKLPELEDKMLETTSIDEVVAVSKGVKLPLLLPIILLCLCVIVVGILYAKKVRHIL